MENKFTSEQIEKAKVCKTIDELIALAKENGTEPTEAEATNLFARLNPENGELADSELEAIAGGGCFDDDEIPELEKCPKGGKHKWDTCDNGPTWINYLARYECQKCGAKK